MTEEKQQKSNTKNSNPKIGRPAKTDQQEQFKNHYLQNRKKFQLECQLLVYIHHIFFDEIPTHPTNQRTNVSEMLKLFEQYQCMDIYRTLAKLNEHYYKSSSLFPEEKLRYTSVIDITYLMRQIKIDHGNQVNAYALIMLVFFFLFNQKVVNAPFYDYFSKRVQLFRNGMINGPDHCELNKMDTLIIALGLEVAIREGVMIQEEVEDDNQEAQKEEEGLSEGMDIQNPRDMASESEEEEGEDSGSDRREEKLQLPHININSPSARSQSS